MESLFKIEFHEGLIKLSESKFLGISIDTIFTVLITISIFFIGEYFIKRRNNLKEKRRLSRLKEYYIVMIQLLEDPLTKQIDAINKFVTQLNEPREQNHTLITFINSPIKQINGTNTHDLYAALVKHSSGEVEDKNKAFSRLLSSTEHIDNILSETLQREFKELMVELDSYTQEYKENLKNVINTIHLCSSPDQKSPKTRTFIFEVTTIRNNWLDTDNHTDIYVSYHVFIEKVQNILKETAHFEPIIHEINNHVMGCIYAFDNILHVKKTYASLLEDYGRGLESSHAKITNSITLLTKGSTN